MNEVQTENTELLIIGAGPAGLSAARAAADAGMSVLVIDDNPLAGGQIWRGGPERWKDVRSLKLWEYLKQQPQVRFLHRVKVAAVVAPQEILAEMSGRAMRIRWQKLILCQGARELLLPFPGWTLPGVTGAGGLQALVKTGAPLNGQRVVVGGSGPLLLAVADTLQTAGAQVQMIAEQQRFSALLRFWFSLLLAAPSKAWQALGLFWRLRKIPYKTSAWVSRVSHDQQGGDALTATIHSGSADIQLNTDWLACGFGLIPNTELATLFGCKTEDGAVVVGTEQQTSVDNIWAAGEITGVGGVDKALAEGRVAGLAASGQQRSAARYRAVVNSRKMQGLLKETFALREEIRHLADPQTIACRCEDVRMEQLLHADWRTAKLMTRLGMGPCQGKICGAACEAILGWKMEGQRQPVFPVRAATLIEGMKCDQQESSE